MIKLKAAIFVMLVAVVTVWGYSSSPPDGYTGAPGEGLCTVCHSSFQPNSGDGLLEISGLPANYDPNSTYNLTISLSDPGQQRWGFELAVKDSNNQQAGAIIVTDAINTQSSTSGGITYLKQTSTGTYAGTADGPVSWIFDWTAPPSGTGKVYFYLAGVAANNASGTNGDYVYNLSQEIPEKFTGVGEDKDDQLDLMSPHKFDLQQNYPNPFNPATTINYSSEREGLVQLSIYNILGQKVRTLVNEIRPQGSYSVEWDSRDDKGKEVAGGVYFYILKVGDYRSSKKMMLIK